ncbi:MAG: cell division protein ZapA [Rikenellaceae bacterium]
MAIRTFSVQLAERKYYLEIDESDEEVMRRAAKRLNHFVAELTAKYDCTAFDHLAMASLMVAIEAEEAKMQFKYSEKEKELDELAAEVRRALEDND